MSFPFTYAKEIKLNIFCQLIDIENNFINVFYNELLDSNFKDISKNSNSLSFKGGFFRLPGKRRTLFNLINNGEITVKPIDDKVMVYYSFNFSHLFIATLIMVVFFPLLLYLLSASFPPLGFYFFSTILGFAWLYGGGVFFTLLRFELLLRRIVKKCRQTKLKQPSLV